jgi:coproporphyrinogen III oxidase-like Fe-S oxidoreductase
LQACGGLVERLCAKGLMRHNGDRLCLSPHGMVVSNSILECLV